MSEDVPMDQNRDRVAELFQNKTLLITGGTGFVGKVSIEKILRVLNVKKIFVLVRTKKGADPKERFEKIFSDPFFDLLKKTRGRDILDKVCFIGADVSKPNLDLSDRDRKMLTEEVEMIFHCAATIRFDERLRYAVFLNVRGTKFMLELAKECKKLLVFLYLSTAYCHLNERVLYEKVYPPPADPADIISLCENRNEEEIDAMSSEILNGIPNSYAFTKSLAESLVTNEMENLPIMVMRPSIILPIWKEPIPGWVDNFNGAVGLLIAAGKGVLRTMYSRDDVYADYVPVDVIVNSMLVGIGDYITYKKRRIYNVTSSAEYKLTFGEILEIGRNIVYNKLPLNGVFWYPGGDMTQSRLYHRFAFFFYQWLPAVVVDVLLTCLGYKPFMKRVQRRILNGYEVFEYYTNRQWDFNNDDSMDARKLMSERERELYKVDGDGVIYEDYFYECIRCARLYLLNEPDETIPAAKRHMKTMYIVDRICKSLIIFGFFYIVWNMIF